MKKILFPALNRVHVARQHLLLKELRRCFKIDIQEFKPIFPSMVLNALAVTGYFLAVVEKNDYDLVLIRGDRYEMLPVTTLCAYREIPIAHLEGGDLSGAIDNKVRYAITALADLHFATNEDSYERLIKAGTNPNWTFNFGSLDVEVAKKVRLKKYGEDFILMCHHALKGEDPALIEKIIREEFKGKLIIIKSNSDYGKSYGTEEFSPEDYIRLLAKAKCLVGNSSSFLKEASIFGTPALIIGDRQENRLFPPSALRVPFQEFAIREGLKMQLESRYEPSGIYYQKNTSRKIAEKIKDFLDGTS
jgi:UDP-N-acetylglucosamine 2-epimerase